MAALEGRGLTNDMGIIRKDHHLLSLSVAKVLAWCNVLWCDALLLLGVQDTLLVSSSLQTCNTNKHENCMVFRLTFFHYSSFHVFLLPASLLIALFTPSIANLNHITALITLLKHLVSCNNVSVMAWTSIYEKVIVLWLLKDICSQGLFLVEWFLLTGKVCFTQVRLHVCLLTYIIS